MSSTAASKPSKKRAAPADGGDGAGAAAPDAKRVKNNFQGEEKRDKAFRAVNIKYNELIDLKASNRNPEFCITQILSYLKHEFSGSATQFCANPDGSRALQACLKHGTTANRMEVLAFLNGGEGGRGRSGAPNLQGAGASDAEKKRTLLPDIATSASGAVLVEKLLAYVPRVLNTTDDSFGGERLAQGKKKGEKPPPLSKEQKLDQEHVVRAVVSAFLVREQRAGGVDEKKFYNLFMSKGGCRVVNTFYNSTLLKQGMKNELINQLAVPAAVQLRIDALPTPKNGKTVKFDKSATLAKLVESLIAASADCEKTLEVCRKLAEHLGSACEKALDKELLKESVSHGLFHAHVRLCAHIDMQDNAKKAAEGKEGEEGDEKKGAAFRLLKESVLLTDAAPPEAQLHLLSSKFGTETLIRLAGFFSAKQKKGVLKALKGSFAQMATNNVNYLLVARLLLTIDDTVAVSKQVLSELLTDEAVIKEVLNDQHGRKAIYPALLAASNRLYSPSELELLTAPAPTALKEAGRRREELGKAAAPAVARFFKDCGALDAMFSVEDDASNEKEKIKNNKEVIQLLLLAMQRDSGLCKDVFANFISKNGGLSGNLGDAYGACEALRRLAIILLKNAKAEEFNNGPGAKFDECCRETFAKNVDAAFVKEHIAGSAFFFLNELWAQYGTEEPALKKAFESAGKKELEGKLAAAEKKGQKVDKGKDLVKSVLG